MIQINWSGNILVFFKQGDQDADYGGIYHNEIVTYIDPEEWHGNHGNVPILGDNNLDTVAYATLLFPRSFLQNVKDAIATNMTNRLIEVEGRNKQGRILLNDSLPFFDSVRANWLAKGVRVEPVEVPAEQVSSVLKLVSGDILAARPKVKDSNVWTGGSRTFGTVGDYLTRSSMYADIGSPASEYFATQISDITDSGGTINNGTQTYNEDGGNYQTFSSIIHVEPTGTATYNFRRTVFQISSGTGDWTILARVLGGGGSTFNWSDSKFNGNNTNCCGLIMHAGFGFSCHFNLWNLMTTNFVYYGMYSYPNAHDLLTENLVFSGCLAGGWYATGGDNLKNSVFLNCTPNILTTYSGGDSTSTNCATDKASVGANTDVGSQVNIVPATEFYSTTYSDATAFKVKSGGQLATNGTATSIPGNTAGFYGTQRPALDGFISIGVDEHKPMTLSSFDSSAVSDGSSVNSLADLGKVVSTVQAVGANPYFDSTAKIRRIDAVYTQQPDARQTKRIVHNAPNFVAPTSWTHFAHDGTWAKTSVRVYDWNDAIAVIPQANIPTYENLTHSDGTMNLNS